MSALAAAHAVREQQIQGLSRFKYGQLIAADIFARFRPQGRADAVAQRGFGGGRHRLMCRGGKQVAQQGVLLLRLLSCREQPLVILSAQKKTVGFRVQCSHKFR